MTAPAVALPTSALPTAALPTSALPTACLRRLQRHRPRLHPKAWLRSMPLLSPPHPPYIAQPPQQPGRSCREAATEVAPPRCRLRCKRASLRVLPPHRKLETFTNFVEGSSAGSTFAPVLPPSPAAPFVPLEVSVPSPAPAPAVGGAMGGLWHVSRPHSNSGVLVSLWRKSA